MAAQYDAIVLGLGGVGSAAMYHLAKRQARVLGIEQFPLVHDRGSSHGDTRVIRLAYFEHPDYVPLLRRSWKLWRDLEQESARELLFQVGLLEVGPPDGEVIPGVLASAEQHGLAVDQLTPADCEKRFAGFRIPEDCVAVFEQQAGYLLVEQCVETHLTLARQQGAEVIAERAVTGWTASDRHVVVTTANAEYQADSLIITAGSWAANLLPELGVPLEVRRQHLHWFRNDSPLYRNDTACPTFLFETGAGIYYGFPETSAGVKIGRHDLGEVIRNPSQLSREVDQADLDSNVDFVKKHMPHLATEPVRHAVCMYTMTPDGHFLVDRHPAHRNVVFAAGLSGHGFKFVPALGECLAEMASGGEAPAEVRFLSLDRFRGQR